MYKTILDHWIDNSTEPYMIQMDSVSYAEMMIERKAWIKKYGAPFADENPDILKYRGIDIEVIEATTRFLRVI